MSHKRIILSPPEVLVSGTPGGVGSVATLLLAQLGYHVVALTGPDNSGGDFLKSLGAAELLDRETLQAGWSSLIG